MAVCQRVFTQRRDARPFLQASWRLVCTQTLTLLTPRRRFCGLFIILIRLFLFPLLILVYLWDSLASRALGRLWAARPRRYYAPSAPFLRQRPRRFTAPFILVIWFNQEIKLSQILDQIQKIGYHAKPFQPEQHEATYRQENQAFLKRLGLAGLMTMQVMMLNAGVFFDL